MFALAEIMYLPCYCKHRDSGCSWQDQLIHLEDHLTECKYTVRETCPFSAFHCPFKGEITKHLSDNIDVHNSLMITYLKKLIQSLDANECLLKNVKTKTDDMIMLDAETEDRTISMAAIIDAALVVIEEEDTIDIIEKIDDLKELVVCYETDKKTFNAFHEKFHKLMENVDKHIVLHDDMKRVDEKKKKRAGREEELKDTLNNYESRLEDIKMRLRIHQCSSNDGYYVWKIDNISKRLRNAKVGNGEELYTPPLYTSPFGYKYSGKVMLNGTRDNLGGGSNMYGKFLSFFIVIMQGDFDDILYFPFPYPVHVTLLNCDGNANILYTIEPDADKPHFQKPRQTMNPAIGFSRFCSHEMLFSNGFIKDDAIFFRIEVDKIGVDVKEPYL